MFARFDENPAMTLRVIKETKRYGRTDARTDGRTDGRTDNVKTVYPLQTKFAGGIITRSLSRLHRCTGRYVSLLFPSNKVMFSRVEAHISAAMCDFQQCGILTSVDSDEPVQPPFKLRNSKRCSVSSLTFIEYSSN